MYTSFFRSSVILLFLSFSVLPFFSAMAVAGVLVYSTFIGGSSSDQVYDIAIDIGGNAYVVGATGSLNFPKTAGAIDTTLGGTKDVFISKLNPAGTVLLYSTLLGGSNDDDGIGIAVDGSQNIYVVGYTRSSTDFPTTSGAYDQTFNDAYYSDNFITKLDNTGSNILYSTFIGGNGYDQVHGFALDNQNNAYITGFTDSSNYPCTPGAWDSTYNGGYDDIFVTKLSGDGSSLVYSTYIGGNTYDLGLGITVDISGNAYITGWTDSINFPVTPGVFDTTFNGGYADAFIVKLDSAGANISYATYLGGNKYDWGYDIGIDNSGNAYITGYTESSTTFPTVQGGISTTYRGGGTDAYVSKLSADGSTLLYSIFLGGSGVDYGYAIAVRPESGEAYVTGYTEATADYRNAPHDFPVTATAFDTTYGGYDDSFISKLSADGSQLLYSSLIGGFGFDYGYGIAVDNFDNVYLTGWSNSSSDFPTSPGAYDRIFNGGQNDVFVTKLALNWFNNHGGFANAADTMYWYYEKYGDGTAAGTVSWVTGYNGQSGVLKLMQNAGEKGKITQIFSVASAGWYTAVAKVATDIADITKQQKVYLYLQQLNSDTAIVATGNLVVQSGNSGLIGAGIWKQLQISFYAQETLLGIQVVGINPASTSITGSIYIDDVWVYAGAAEPTETVTLSNPSFDSGTTDWLVQNYADGT
ncbi:MAG: SBBP repeat-containing protein, partial [bacterium]